MKNINLMIFGYNGKLGSKICIYAENYNYKIVKLYRNLSNLEYKENSIIIDVTSIEGTSYLLDKLIENNINLPLIIGTTGDFTNLNKKIEIYKSNFEKKICNKDFSDIAVIKVSNFSYGIPEIEKILRNFDTEIWQVKIKEIHHINKKDAPSGTAKTLADIVNYNYSDIQSIREGEIYGIHEISLNTNDEEIIIIHKAKNRDIFAKGLFRFVERISNYYK